MYELGFIQTREIHVQHGEIPRKLIENPPEATEAFQTRPEVGHLFDFKYY